MHIVIMAGGRGTRFWPRSRIQTPKQLINIVGEDTMLRQTFDRAQSLTPSSHIWVVTNEEYRSAVAEQLSELPEDNIIAEPLVRSTAPCIGLAALHIHHRADNDVMAVLPADHYIPDEDLFRACIRTGVETATRESALLTIGIQPTHPDTGYGYIEVGDLFSHEDGQRIHRVTGFREKPDYETAKAFLDDGRHLWNSGMFIWTTSVILGEFERHCPEIYTGLSDIADALGAPEEDAQVRRAYASFPTISIDYAVMEKASHVYVIEGRFRWSDVGSWSAVQPFWEQDENGNAVRGRVVSVDSSGSIIESRDKLVALVGLEDMIVIDTPDVLLVCRKDRDQDIKRVIEHLNQHGLTEYL